VSDPAAAPTLCVYCRRNPVETAWRPFCSKRCQQLDLAKWVDGDYRVAGEPMADEVTLETVTPEPPPPSTPSRRRS